MKTCTNCGVEKPLNEFPKRNTTRCGVHSNCKTCTNARLVAAYHANPEVRKARQRSANEHYARLRAELIREYGGKCTCCGESEPKFLSIDHINGGGAEHRRRIGEGGKALANYLRRNGYPKDEFRLLCFNCNCAIGFFGACPHQKQQQLDTQSGCTHSYK